MSNELTVANLADTIRDRVRTQIVNVIPDEQIDGLIKKEWESFFVTPPRTNNWDTTEKKSAFQTMIEKEVNAYFTTKVKESLDKQLEIFTQASWDAHAKKYLNEFVKGYAPMALEGIGARLAEAALQNAQNNFSSMLSNNRGY